MKIPDVLTCSVVLPWVRMPISSIHFLVPSVRWLRVLHTFERCCPCFLFLSHLRFFSDFSHFSFSRRPSVIVFFRRVLFIHLFCYFFYIIAYFCYFFPQFCFPVQQTTNRISDRVQCFFVCEYGQCPIG